MADNQEIINRLTTIEAWALEGEKYFKGIALECRQTRKLMQADDVSTSSNDTGLSLIAQAARKNLRERFVKRTK